MWSEIIKAISIIFSVLGLSFLMKLLGKNEQKQQDLKDENSNLQQNIKINKEVSDMSISAKSNFLLSKQRNKNS